jgi:tRNA (guanine-N7-)-methyltransferase
MIETSAIESPPNRTPNRTPERIRSFNPRRGRVSALHDDTFRRLWPAFGVPVSEEKLDLEATFGRRAPLVVEIGSGMGEASAAMAAADPGRDYLAIEVHYAGIASLLGLLDAAGATNARVARGDAVTVLTQMLPPGSVDAIHIFFPDPWPKVRHHKRRLIRAENVAMLHDALRPGGTLHLATDWPAYAKVMHDLLAAHPGLRNTGYAQRPAWRPITKFEQRGIDAGRPIADLIFRRTG